MATLQTTIVITAVDVNEYNRLKQWLTDTNDTKSSNWNPTATLDDINLKVTLADTNSRNW